MCSGTLTYITNQVSDFLIVALGNRVSAVHFVGAGLFSQAFSFNMGVKSFIIRLNMFQEDFLKDQFAYQNYSATKLPIPEVLRIGEYEKGIYYSITRRCDGDRLDTLDENTNLKLTPALFDALFEIHGYDVSNVTGWGLMNAGGKGLFPSWEVYLRSFYNQKFSFDWSYLVGETMLESDVYEALMDTFDGLLSYIPQKKWLVHGDFGFDNVFSDGNLITGILDWAEALLGDILYDVAYLDFWSKEIPYGKLWHEHNRAQDLEVPYFEECIRCYMLHIGLGSLAIAALTDDHRSYLRVRERTRSVLLPGRRSSSDWTQEI
jgi:hygromycin-B 4-O-kinase